MATAQGQQQPDACSTRQGEEIGCAVQHHTGIHLRLNHSDVAPHHCTICVWPENRNGHMFLEPEGGAVVLLNGLKVEKAQALNKGDVFSIGPFDFGVVDSGFLSKAPKRRGEFVSLLDSGVRGDCSDVISDEIDWYIDNYLHRPQND